MRATHFVARLAHGWDRPLGGAAEIHAYGRPASAEVLSVEDVALDPRGVRTARLTLRVTPVNERPYRTRRVLALPRGHVPAVGQRVAVKFDPQRPRECVLLERSFDLGAARAPRAPRGPARA